MMLDDAAIERFSRQILLPEVGGRGQERLFATQATVRGAAGRVCGDAAAAGVDVRHDTAVRRVAIVQTGRPCWACARAAAVVATLVAVCAPAASPRRPDLPAAATLDDAPAARVRRGPRRRRYAALGLATDGRPGVRPARGTFLACPLAASCGAPRVPVSRTRTPSS
jgi:hypothetical protein